MPLPKPTKPQYLPTCDSKQVIFDAYWRELRDRSLSHDYGPIQSLDFSPVKPNLLAVTNLSKVELLDPSTLETERSFNVFKEPAFGASFRSDGRLLTAGGMEGVVRVLDVNSRSVLRKYTDHKAAVYCTKFLPDNFRLASFGDDETVRVFDLSNQQQLLAYEEHAGNVRCGAVFPNEKDLICSASHDGTCRIWDVRTPKSCDIYDHGATVQAVAVYPSGRLIISVGGRYLKIWDRANTKKCLTAISDHAKATTCVVRSKDGKYILTGSVDKFVRVYDGSTFESAFNIKNPSPVLSLAVSDDCDKLAIGLVDGKLKLRTRKKPIDFDKLYDKYAEKKSHKFSLANELSKKPMPNLLSNCTTVPALERNKEAKYDSALRHFDSTAAFNFINSESMAKEQPETSVAVLLEMERRGTIENVFKTMNDTALWEFMRFLNRYACHARFSAHLLPIASIFFKLHPNLQGRTNDLDNQLKALEEKFKYEGEHLKGCRLLVEYIDELLEADGTGDDLVDSYFRSETTTTEVKFGLVEESVQLMEEVTEEVTEPEAKKPKCDD